MGRTRNTRQKSWIKILRTERYNVFQSAKSPHLFRLNWKDASGNYHRVKINEPTIDDAIAQIPGILGLCDAPAENEVGLTIEEAFDLALQHTRRGEQARKDWLREQVRFMRWLASHYPVCSHWKQLKRQMVREYLDDMFSGRSDNRKRLAMQPVTQTARFMTREFNLPNITERLGIGNKLVKMPPMVYLEDVVAFLDWLSDRDPRIAVGVALQGLAGLQLKEALRLTWNKVDLDQGLIEISGEVKNVYRKRVMPVCNRVVQAIRDSLSLWPTGVIPMNDPVVPSHQGCSFAQGLDSWKNYSRLVAQSIKTWNSNLGWTPKDLRNCLPTFAVHEGIHNDIWEQYLGHVPRSVTAKHYIPRLTSASMGETRALDRQMDVFRLQVVEPIEISIMKYHEKSHEIARDNDMDISKVQSVGR